MTAKRCLTISELEIGQSYETEFSFTRSEVRSYCELAEDKNSIHSDVEAARLRFPDAPDVIVPGGLIQIRITGLFGSVLPGDGSLGLTFIPDRFRRPIFPGDFVKVAVILTRLRGAMAEFDIKVCASDGVQSGAATTRLIVPDEEYKDWWRKNKKEH